MTPEGNALGERRRSSRRGLTSDEPLGRAKLRTGGALTVLNASSHGILAESRDRLLPGRNIDVHIVTTAGRQLVRAKVARAYVQHLTAEAVLYRAALGFDQPVDVQANGYAVPAVPLSAPIPEGNHYPDRQRQTEIVFTERPVE